MAKTKPPRNVQASQGGNFVADDAKARKSVLRPCRQQFVRNGKNEQCSHPRPLLTTLKALNMGKIIKRASGRNDLLAEMLK